MLIEFRVENHRSLPMSKSLTRGPANLGDDSDRAPSDSGWAWRKIAPGSVLYGANASGKTNVLSSLAFIREAVLQSHRVWERISGVPRSPFGWGPLKP